MKYYFRYIFLLIGMLISCHSIHAQWGFTVSQQQSGNCSNYGDIKIIVNNHIGNMPINGFPTKQECEQARSILSNIKERYGNCTLYLYCTQCSGKDLSFGMPSSMNGSQGSFGYNSNSGSLTFNGLDLGMSFFSPNPGQSIQDWIEQVNQKMKSLEDLFSNDGFIVPHTGNKEFDNVYGSLAYKGLSPSLDALREANKGKGAELNVNDVSQLRVNTQQDTPSLPNLDLEKNMQIAGIEHEMRLALAERSRIERFCASSHLDCRAYQDRLAKAEQKIKDAKDKLFELKLTGYNSDIERYNRDIEKYEQNIKKCPTIMCESDMRKAIEETKNKISSVEKDIQGVRNEINNKEITLEKRTSQWMSNADKKEEIANERLRRIEEQLASGEITRAEATLMKTSAYTDKGAAITERTATNVYNYTQEKIEIIKDVPSVVKDMITGKYDDDPEVAKYQTLTISNIYEVASYVTPDGPSQVLGILSDEGKKLANNENINPSTLVYNSITGLGKNKVIEKALGNYAPIYSKVSQVRYITNESVEGIENLVNWYNATVSNRQKNNSEK